MNWLIITLFIMWFYIMTVLKRAKLDFWYFCTGSVGMFFFLLVVLQPVLTEPLTKFVAYVTGFVGHLSGLFESYHEHGIVFIQRKTESISLCVDYECSGIIEIFAFVSLLTFFSVYRTYEKVIITVFGILAIFTANIIRITAICVCIYYKGNSIFFVAHTILGRLIFYALSIVLYFYVFTKAHIVRQKVGSFKYETH